MTQDYRKRAEEFCKKHFGPWVNGLDTDNLARAFQQIAQEARREENEACKHEVDVFKDSLGLHLHSRITSRIRLRLEGK